jgi:phage gp46-like protein
MTPTCTQTTSGRRRVFWASRPCTTADLCGSECAKFGLELITSTRCEGDGCSATDTGPCAVSLADTPRSVNTADWVRGLMANILLTDGVTSDSVCGFAPGTRGGHWSASFRNDGGNSGTNIRKVKPGKSVQENISAIQVEAQLAASKLVQYGVALSATATVEYAGANTYSLEIAYVGVDNSNARVGFTGARLANAFVWGV